MAVRKPWEMSLNTAVWVGETLATLTDDQLQALELLTSYQAAQAAWGAAEAGTDATLAGLAIAFNRVSGLISEARTTGLAQARKDGGLRSKDDVEDAAAPANTPVVEPPPTPEELQDALEYHALSTAPSIPVPFRPAPPALVAPKPPKAKKQRKP